MKNQHFLTHDINEPAEAGPSVARQDRKASNSNLLQC